MIDQGQLVSDDLVNQMVADRLKQPDTHRGYILDGFPAHARAGHLARRAACCRRQHALPVVAISIVVDYDAAAAPHHGPPHLARCRRIYNIYSNPPKVAGICDVDGSPLVQRPDDSEAVFTERMKTFEAQTAPVIEHYRKHRAASKRSTAITPVEQVTAAIDSSALKRLRRDSSSE